MLVKTTIQFCVLSLAICVCSVLYAEDLSGMCHAAQSLCAQGTFEDRTAYCTDRARTNYLGSLIFVLVLKNQTEELYRVFEDYQIEDVKIPSAATRGLQPREREKLRLAQWSFVKTLTQRLGTSLTDFANDLQSLVKFPNSSELIIDEIKVEANSARAQLKANGSQFNIRFKRENNTWLYDGLDTKNEFNIYPKFD